MKWRNQRINGRHYTKDYYYRGGILFKPLKHIYRLRNNPAYREFYRLRLCYGGLPRYEEKKIKFSDYEFIVPDAGSFLSTYEELFVHRIYEFQPSHEGELCIVDFGANIGLSVLFFALNYPNVRIDAYEADPSIYRYLQMNLQSCRMDSQVRLFNEAVWTENGTLDFYSEGADAGRIVSSPTLENRVKVKCMDANAALACYERIDFLKIDIEGAEGKVVPHLCGQLHKVQNIFVEYHSVSAEQQKLREILDVLQDSGFRLYGQTGFCPRRPFVQQETYLGFDFQMNIFGVRKAVCSV